MRPKTKRPPLGLKTFYKKNPTFDIRNFDFHNPDAVADLKIAKRDQKRILGKLKAQQRLMNIDSDPEVVNMLENGGMDSARAITAMSQSMFVKKFKGDLGEKKATQVYKKANQVKTQVMHLWANVNQVKKSPYYMALQAAPAPQAAPDKTFENLSSYQEIFGSLNFCDCSECKSILGPAAYLVDLLRLIDKGITKPNTSGDSADNIPDGLTFNDRRPDIAKIKLTCSNTNDLVPYLQIVNEILEETIAGKLSTSDVYKTISGLYYPFNLPFNKPLAEIRTYLEQNNASLSDIYSVMDKNTGEDFSVGAAREYLNISPTEMANLSHQTGDLTTVLNANYGTGDKIKSDNELDNLNKVDDFVTKADMSLNDFRTLIYQNLSTEEIFNVAGSYTTTERGDTITFTQKGNSIQGTYNENNGVVKGTLIGQTVQGEWMENNAGTKTNGYFEFVFTNDCASFNGQWNTGLGKPWETSKWNGTRKSASGTAIGGIIPNSFFINKVFASPEYLKIKLNTSTPDEPYNEIVNLNVASLDTLNRFIRLSRKLNWTFEDLDWLLLSIAKSTATSDRKIGGETFQKLAIIKELNTKYDIPFNLLSTLWYDIKTTGIGNGQFSSAPFDQIFNGPEQVGSGSHKLYRPAYADPSTYTRFVNPLYTTTAEPWVIDQTDSANSNTVADTIVSGIPASMDDIRLVAKAVFGTVNSIDLTVENLSALYRHTMLAKTLNIQVKEYLKLLALIGITNENNSDLTAAILTPHQVLQITQTLEWLKNDQPDVFTANYVCTGEKSTYVNPGYNVENVPHFVDSLNSSMNPALVKPNAFQGPGITADASEAILAWLVDATHQYINSEGLVLNDKDLKAEDLPDSVTLKDKSTYSLKDAQKKYIVSTYSTFKSNQNKLFISHLANFYGIKEDFFTLIISQLTSLFDDKNYLEKFISKTPDGSYISKFIDNAARFILMYQSPGLNNVQIKGIIENATAFSQTYEVDKTNHIFTCKLDNLHAVYRFTRIENDFDDIKNELVDYFRKIGTDGFDANQKLAEISGWYEDQLVFLLEHFYGKGAHCSTVDQLDQLNRVFTLTNQLGIDAYFAGQLNDMANWTNAGENWDNYNKYSTSLLKNVRSNTSKDAWPTVFKKINGELEESKRNALLQLAVWLMGQEYKDINTANDLYEYLLIDVKRAGCQDISYIKEALNAAQLYLQRCRLNLERNVTIDKSDIPEIYWEWIMNYRVWEVNREIFLYPENYIDPSLRKSKTDLFETLENDLNQGNVNKDTVEAAYKKYLDSFRELATLKYVDAYRCYTNGKEDPGSDTLFLMARTQVKPYQYYYISRGKGDIWSQWNKVNITINAPTVSTVFAFNKLFVFWTELTTLTENDGSNSNNKRTTIKASIMYSFYNFSGDWAQPQTLVKDQLVYTSGSDDFIKQITNDDKEILPPDLFDFTRLSWQKVNVISLTDQNYWRKSDNRSKSDKLLISFGPQINTSTYSEPLAQPTVTDTNIYAHEFEETLNQTVENINTILNSKNNKGYVSVFPGIVLEDNLEEGFLIYPYEFELIEKNVPDDFPPGVPFLDHFTDKLYTIESDSIIHTNYIPAPQSSSQSITGPNKLNQNSFVSSANPAINGTASQAIYTQLISTGYLNSQGNIIMANMDFGYLRSDLQSILNGQPDETDKVNYCFNIIAMALGSPLLFSELNGSQDSVIQTTNDPYSFIINHGTESFLMINDNNQAHFINEQAEILKAIFNKNSFITETIDSASSKLIFEQLQAKGYMDDEGRFYNEAGYSDTLDVLKSILDGQPDKDIMVQESINVLFHQPLFNKDSFIATDIPSGSSETIFTQLQAKGYIDTFGRLNANYAMSDVIQALQQILARQPNEDLMIREVVSIILKTRQSSSIKYFKATVTEPPKFDPKLNATRLTTSAILRLSSTLFSQGIDGLLSLKSQNIPVDSGLSFDRLGASELYVTPPKAIDGDQVDFQGPFGNYYWELFFHGPMLVSEILNTNQKFQDAENWLQYIFNPTLSLELLNKDSFETNLINASDSEAIYTFCKTQGYIKADGFVDNSVNGLTPAKLEKAMNDAHLRLQQNITIQLASEVLAILQNNYMSSDLSRYWQFLPFRNHSLEKLVDQLTNPNEIHAYDTDPFDPHAIARLRIGAYEKTVVMKYISNLIDWGDSEFRLYTWESITAALMLYIYAYDLLGPRPQDLGPCKSEFPVNFEEIAKKYEKNKDGIPQFLIDMENAISSSLTNNAVNAPINSNGDVPFNDIEAYFCIPENETFIGDWTTVENRLYNIRHCLNINGVPQPLPLFQPPINPMDLVKAAASGNNVLDVASLTQPNIPPYRFDYIINQAKSLTSTLVQLGDKLLSALEKQDSDTMALLQSSNSLNILDLTTFVKEQQIKQLTDQSEALEQNLLNAQNRQSHYKDLVDKGLNGFEIADLTLRTASIVPQGIAAGINGISIAGYLAPNIFGFSDGGMKFGDAINAGAQISNTVAAILNQSAGIVSTAGSYVRRSEEWSFQKDSAGYEVEQIQHQIDASKVNIAVAQQELTIHKKNICQSQSVDDFLKSKFTNEELYQWMIARVSSLYFQTYNLALDMALKAQATYQFELDSEDQLITFNYWDSLHKGLLAGESLMMSLEQMESAYVQHHSRRLEIEKTVSLASTQPEAFMKFKWGHNGGKQGTLDFTLSEKLFDMDFPGHYCRKIKSISVSIPAVIGPYQNLNAMLRQNSNMVVMEANEDAVKFAAIKTVPNSGTLPAEPSSNILRQNWVPDQSIAVSKGSNDSGVFVLNFNDSRYLPFEGTGAVSTWTLNLPPETNHINFDSISDVIITVKYTAKDGGESFAEKVRPIYQNLPNSSGDYIKIKTFDLKQAFSSSWNQLFITPPASGKQSITFPITDNLWFTDLKKFSVENLMIQLEVSDKSVVTASDFLELIVGANSKALAITDNFASLNASELSTLGFGVSTNTCTLSFDLTKTPSTLTKSDGGQTVLDETKLLDIAMAIFYSESPFGGS